MACCKDNNFEAQESRVIDKSLNVDKKNKPNNIRFLLLGAGESGKSTFAKQMRVLHQLDFTDEERESFKQQIVNNMYTSMKRMVNYAIEQKLLGPGVEKNFEEDYCDILTPELTSLLNELWANPAIQTAYADGAKYSLFDSTA